MLLNAAGKRFFNELGYRDELSEAIFKHGKELPLANGKKSPPAVFLVLNPKAAAAFPEAIAFYSFKKRVLRYNNLKAFCEAHEIPYDTAAETFASYSRAANAGKDEFGVTTFPAAPYTTDEALVVLLVTPAIHYTMGGLSIDTDAHVMGEKGPLAGLYAAGEVTGGLHGDNRLGGNSLLECVVFGRIAGQNAADNI